MSEWKKEKMNYSENINDLNQKNWCEQTDTHTHTYTHEKIIFQENDSDRFFESQNIDNMTSFIDWCTQNLFFMEQKVYLHMIDSLFNLSS